jgi:hypothetical protein
MEMLPRSLTGAAAAARDGLAELARSAASAAGSPAGRTQRMAAAARAAVFADALLGAIKARCEEIRTAAK